MTENIPIRRVWARGAASAVTATVLNVLVAEIAGAQLDVSPTFLALQPGPVATVTLLTVVLGTAVAVVLARLVRHSVGIFSIVASVVALASLIAPTALSLDPSTFAGATSGAARALIPLHLIPAAVLIIAVAWRRREVTA